MNFMNSKIFFIKIFFYLSLFYSVMVYAYNPERSFSPSQVPEELKGLETKEHAGDKIDLNLEFINSYGKPVKLKQYFKGQPVLLSIVYYDCPNLCGLHLKGLITGLKDLSPQFKKTFNIVLVSMDSSETTTLAFAKKKNYVKEYSLLKNKIHFLTGSKKNILSLSNQLGFKFKWDNNQKIFAHLPVAYTITPQGNISRYLYGVTFKAQTLRFSLVEASLGKIGSIMDKIFLFCFQFDPKRGRYSWYSYNIMRAGAAVTFILLLFFLIPIWIKESKKSQKRIS